MLRLLTVHNSFLSRQVVKKQKGVGWCIKFFHSFLYFGETISGGKLFITSCLIWHMKKFPMHAESLNKNSQRDSTTRRLAESGSCFWLWISLWIRSQKNPRKSASLPCLFNQLDRQSKRLEVMNTAKYIFVGKENLIKILFYNIKVKLPQISFIGFD
jgi:hypothetical protein